MNMLPATIFTEQDKGRLGSITSDLGMDKLGRSMDNLHATLPAITSESDFIARIQSKEYVETVVLGIAALTMNASLPSEAVNDPDVRDDVRWQIRRPIKMGLFAGRLIARGCQDG